MTRHSGDCDCPDCLRWFEQYTLWLATIFTLVAVVSFAAVAVWLYRLFF